MVSERYILVIADGSKEMDVALQYACARSKKTNRKIIIATFIEPIDVLTTKGVSEIMQNEAREEAEKKLKYASSIVKEATGITPVLHLREGEMLKAVAQYSARVNNRCIVMPNLNDPITTFKKGLEYKVKIMSTISEEFTPLIPCYLIDNLNLKDFRQALEKEIFIGAKFYPINATTNSELGISKIENIFPALEILAELNKPLLIHGEKVSENIDFFDREKFFIDTDLFKIIKNFTNLNMKG